MGGTGTSLSLAMVAVNEETEGDIPVLDGGVVDGMQTQRDPAVGQPPSLVSRSQQRGHS